MPGQSCLILKYMTQVLATAMVVGLIAHFVAGQAGPAALVIGNGLALSSTAVVLQVSILISYVQLYQRISYLCVLFINVSCFWNTKYCQTLNANVFDVVMG